MFGQIDGTGFEVLDPRFDSCFVGCTEILPAGALEWYSRASSFRIFMS